MAVKLKHEEYEFIKEEVIDLFVRYGVRCIPISGFELAMKMDIRLVPYSSLPKDKKSVAMKISPDGFFFEPGDGNEYIYFNDSVGYERSNMTILHEIGHDVLGHSSEMDPDVAETEARFFAKYAIAPPPLIHRIKPDCPEEIADAFAITYTAAYYAFEYYRKWLHQYRQSGKYSHYEIQLLTLFPNCYEGVIGMS